MSDEDIIIALGMNHFSKAMKPLYKYLPAVVKLIKANGGTKEDAEDIFQDALVLLCRKIKVGNFKLTSSLNTFVYAVCKNLWREEMRKKNKTAIVETELSEEDELFIKSEQQYQQAEQAFAQLGEKCRSLLMLFYFHKKNMVEIASALGFSNEKVAKNQKYRCLEKAKENYTNLKNQHNEN